MASEYTAGLVRSYCLIALTDRGMTTEEICVGCRDHYKEDVKGGFVRMGASTVYDALSHWEKCDVIHREPQLRKHNGKLKYRKVWLLGEGKKKKLSILSPSIVEKTKDEIRRALEPRSFTTFEGVRTFSGVVNGKALKKALEEMTASGEVIVEHAELSRRRTLHLYKLKK